MNGNQCPYGVLNLHGWVLFVVGRYSTRVTWGQNLYEVLNVHGRRYSIFMTEGRYSYGVLSLHDMEWQYKNVLSRNNDMWCNNDLRAYQYNNNVCHMTWRMCLECQCSLQNTPFQSCVFWSRPQKSNLIGNMNYILRTGPHYYYYGIHQFNVDINPLMLVSGCCTRTCRVQNYVARYWRRFSKEGQGETCQKQHSVRIGEGLDPTL